MPVYISLLRGINLGGHKLVAMDKLRAAVEDLGGTGVRTYIQSGNLVFRARKSSPEAWSKKIATMLLREFGFPVLVITRTSEEFEALVRDNPFATAKEMDG